MGLIIGVGDTRPAFAYDYYYGIEWDATVSNPHPTRIGKTELHKSLPLQSCMRRCVLKDDGSVNYYLHASDSTMRDDGAAADLTGADGQYMVELPGMYVRFETNGDKSRHLQSTEPLPGFRLWRKDYVSAVEATVQRSAQELCAVVNDSADYRGGDDDASRDGTYRSQLGRPATSVGLTDLRAYARKRGSAEWNCYLYQTHKKLWWLFAVEYCTFNTQEASNAELTEEGFHQGGLGWGVTKLTGAKWSNFNGWQPFVPCGYTNSLGNKSGYVRYTMPFEYDANGAANYAGEYDAKTAYSAGQYVSHVSALYACKADAEAGTALKDTAHFTQVNRLVVRVPSYRGVENPFGHVWKLADGCKILVQGETDGGLSEFYVCNDPAAFTSSGTAGYQLCGNLPREAGYVKKLVLGEDGEIMPLEVGAGSTTFFCDSIDIQIPASRVLEVGAAFGGSATGDAGAGFVSARASTGKSASAGSRLCFYPRIEP